MIAVHVSRGPKWENPKMSGWWRSPHSGFARLDPVAEQSVTLNPPSCAFLEICTRDQRMHGWLQTLPQDQREKTNKLPKTPTPRRSVRRKKEINATSGDACIHAGLDSIHSESLSMLSIPFNPLRLCTKKATTTASSAQELNYVTQKTLGIACMFYDPPCRMP
ncbi:hypothetical protein GW17_00037257 [Ensete ventricosum]|nr:hypothetical protein GW17_00037257 [Ensete ventricosum]